MTRQALVVGINRYPNLRQNINDRPPHLTAPAKDAEAIAQLLERYGDFRVQRLPKIYNDLGKEEVNPNPYACVRVSELEEAIANLFNPPDKRYPNTALLFFAGHGWWKERGQIREVFLATSDAYPRGEIYGVSLNWLRKLLQNSPVREQIVWLDCCFSGELIELFNEANPGNPDRENINRCLIASSRSFRESVELKLGLLTETLLNGLNPEKHVDGWVTNNSLVDYINNNMSNTPQCPVFRNAGGAIVLTNNRVRPAVDESRNGKCPYRGLSYFTEKQEDAVVFYGRTALTDKLIDLVPYSNFIAVSGASGSGKSSVLRAGLLYQLQRGQKISRSDRWKYFPPFTPGQHPLESLRKAILSDSETADAPKEDISSLLQLSISKNERAIFIIDQFEECFTLCSDSQERKQFFACLLEAVEQTDNKLCLLLGMRADFLGKCAEYGELAQKISRHLVMVEPMTRNEIQEAIEKPAELVDLKIESSLITKIIEDVVNCPGSLPLLEYTLTELWNEAQRGASPNVLKLETYKQLGGIEGTLEKRANLVYESLSPEEKPLAKRIFLELTHIGEGVYTRRQIIQENLVNPQHSQTLVEKVVEKLVEARLIFANNESKSPSSPPKVILNIVHEALIRYWRQLEIWITDNQSAIKLERKIETAAQEWEEKGKPQDPDLLWKRAKLNEAERYLEEYGKLGFLDAVAQEFIDESRKLRDREEEKKKEQEAQKRKQLTIGLVVAMCCAAFASAQWWRAESQMKKAEIAKIIMLNTIAEGWLNSDNSNENLETLISNIRAAEKLKEAGQLGQKQEAIELQNQIQENLKQAVNGVLERNRLKGHKDAVHAVSYSPDGQVIASVSSDKTVKLWDNSGRLISTLKDHEDIVHDVVFSPKANLIATASSDRTVRIWDAKRKAQKTILGKGENDEPGQFLSVSFNPDGQLLAAGSDNHTVKIWRTSDNKLIKTLSADEKDIQKIKEKTQKHKFLKIGFSPDGQFIAAASTDHTIKIWKTKDYQLFQTLEGHKDWIYSLGFSSDSKFIVSSGAGNDKTIKVWNGKNGRLLRTIKNAHEDAITAVGFSPEDEFIASAGRDQKLKLWDAKSILYQSLDKNFVFSSHQDILLKTINGNNTDIRDIDFSPNNKLIALAGFDKTVKLWDYNILNILMFKSLKASEFKLIDVNFSKNGKLIGTAGADNKIRIWKADYQKAKDGSLIYIHTNLLHTLEKHKDWIISISFSPDGQFIASASDDNTVKLWRTSDGVLVKELNHDDWVRAVSFSPDGKFIASASNDEYLNIWDSSNGKLIRSHPINSKLPYWKLSLSFSPDGKYIALADSDKNIRLWKTSNGEELNPIGSESSEKVKHQQNIITLSFSPDGETIASAGEDQIIKIWSVKDKKLLRDLKGHNNIIRDVNFSPDGQLIASASQDKTIKIWNRNGELLRTLQNDSPIYSVSFSPDSPKILISADNYGTVKFWNLKSIEMEVPNLDKLLSRGCKLLDNYLQNIKKKTPYLAPLDDSNPVDELKTFPERVCSKLVVEN